jgi:hypothetical protein
MNGGDIKSFRGRECLILLISSLFLITNHSFAQAPKTNKSYFWLNAGVGLEFPGSSVSEGTNISYQWKKYIVSARLNYTADISSSPPASEVVESALLFGVCKKSRFWCSSIAGGLAHMSGTTNNAVRVPTFGFPIEAQIFITPLSFFGIGLYGFGNLNSRMPYFNILLCLQFGKLR